jgi:hypothetical protein
MPAVHKPNQTDFYRSQLQQLPAWDDYLRQESRLPGPRANLELLEVVIEVGDGDRFAHLLALEAGWPEGAPPNTPGEFLTVCAVAGLGKLVGSGERAWLAELRCRAADRRWRVREAVAIALQHWGDHDLPGLIAEMGSWSSGPWLEQRAVVATLAEPRLLRPAAASPPAEYPAEHPAAGVLPLFDAITQAIAAASPADRRTEDYQVLRQALGYAWSVLVAANLAVCRRAFERWLAEAEATGDKDLRWLARQNLQKNRLLVLDRAWAASWQARLE